MESKERMRPLQNEGGRIRRIFDLQVAATYRGIKKTLATIEMGDEDTVLDVGCGAMPYRGLFNCSYQGIDIYEAGCNFDYHQEDVTYYDGVNFPIKDETISMVFSTETMEHIYDTKHFLGECNRVLRESGHLLITVPFSARYHYIPWDYWRFTPSSLQLLLEESGFKDIRIIPRGTDFTVAGYKTLAIGYRLFFSKDMWRKIVSVIFAPIWIISLIVGQISLHCEVGSCEDTLGYIVYCRKDK